MAYGRRTILTAKTNHQILTLDEVTTTNATPTDMYESVIAVPEGRRVYLETNLTVSTPTVSAVSNIVLSCTVARATGGNIRLIDTNFQRASGEIRFQDASAVWRVDTGTQRFYLTVTGIAATTYIWNGYVTSYRVAT